MPRRTGGFAYGTILGLPGPIERMAAGQRPPIRASWCGECTEVDLPVRIDECGRMKV